MGIDAATHLGPVHLTVASLERQAGFYERALGLRTRWREAGRAGLGAGDHDLLVLAEAPAARRFRGTTGLYHFALLVPGRRELARTIARLARLGVPQAPTDHVMTKATYLDDPEGNGIEVYADTPEDGRWFMERGRFGARDRSGAPRSGRDPLDLEELMGHLDAAEPLDAPLASGTRVGHVHLHVADLAAAVRFYRDGLGLEEQGEAGQMAFLSAGGYHHHVGVNTWLGAGAPAPPPGSLGLHHFTVVVPDRAELGRIEERLRALPGGAGGPAAGHPGAPEVTWAEDPSGNRVAIVTRA